MTQPTHVDLKQGTASWHDHRALYRNASEAACVMGDSPFDPDTWAKLWAYKTKRLLPAPASNAMNRGLALEDMARACYEALTGNIMQPQVLVKEAYSASLDGLDINGEIDLEIKCPYKGRDSLTWQMVEDGKIPPYIFWQLMQQLYVSDAKMAHLFVFDGDAEGLLLEVAPNMDAIGELLDQWEKFWAYVQKDIEPPLTDKDVAVRYDRNWRNAADAYKAAVAELEAAEKRVKEARRALLVLDNRHRVTGAGLTITRFLRQGPVEYSKIPALEKVDLDQYRKKPVEQVRITLSDEPGQVN